MENSSKDILNLILQKKDAYDKILYITENAKISEGENAVEEYSSMINARQTIFEEITKIDEKLNSQEDTWKFLAISDSARIDALTHDMEITITKIIDIDNKNKVIATNIMDDVKKNIKEVKNSKEINSYYNSYLTEEGSLFDRQK